MSLLAHPGGSCCHPTWSGNRDGQYNDNDDLDGGNIDADDNDDLEEDNLMDAHLEDDDVLGVVEGAGEEDLGAVDVGHQVVAPRDPV